MIANDQREALCTLALGEFVSDPSPDEAYEILVTLLESDDDIIPDTIEMTDEFSHVTSVAYLWEQVKFLADTMEAVLYPRLKTILNKDWLVWEVCELDIDSADEEIVRYNDRGADPYEIVKRGLLATGDLYLELPPIRRADIEASYAKKADA